MDPFLELVLLAAAVFVGAVLQGVLGFGIGVVSIPVMLILHSELVPAVPLLISLPIIALSLMRERHHVDTSSFLWLTAGRLPGTLAATAFLAVLPEFGVRILAAGILAVVAVLMLTSRGAPVFRKVSGSRRLGIGSLSGFMATSCGVGGPLLALAFRGSKPSTMRGTINATTLIGAVISLLGILLAGRLDNSILMTAGLLLVPALLGLVMSRSLDRHLRSEHISLIVTLSILACCLFVLVQLGVEWIGLLK
ncbi:sulfite exporter TauE/SafE family protein [Brevibacterium oceani]|uniref:sulfite exporter TauE/SafE family protein n=1 Tax=Brevibacterium oceani TaxID=358099 RepID=UPI0015E7E4A6|nr:sulfite exporter TauE/SafE family protein [Brevibacterium oceani]